jgi:lysophospholipase L1-like esterase
MKKLKKLASRKALIVLCILLLLGELFCRFYLGLGESYTYAENSNYEYFPKANLDISRFGNDIQTNEIGMRSAKIDTSKRTILKIGDSVINGGTHVSNSELASSLLEADLNKDQDEFQVLNISAGSWGPDNGFEFIKEHGDFDCELIVIVFSSHDFHDNIHNRTVVGEHPNWPKTQPLSATTDLLGNYLWPKIKYFLGEEEFAYLNGLDDSKINSGWKQFYNYATEKNIPCVFYIHPELEEVVNHKLNELGTELMAYLDSNHINYANGLELGMNISSYRDDIHLNSEGQNQLFLNLLPIIKGSLKM